MGFPFGNQPLRVLPIRGLNRFYPFFNSNGTPSLKRGWVPAGFGGCKVGILLGFITEEPPIVYLMAHSGIILPNFRKKTWYGVLILIYLPHFSWLPCWPVSQVFFPTKFFQGPLGILGPFGAGSHSFPNLFLELGGFTFRPSFGEQVLYGGGLPIFSLPFFQFSGLKCGHLGGLIRAPPFF